MNSRYNEFKDKFNYFSSFFLAMVSVGLAIFSFYIVGGDTLTKPMPILSVIFIGLGLLFAVLALYYGVCMKCTPKDTRLDELLKTVSDLKQHAEANNGNDTFTISLNINGDLSQMKTEQLEAIKYLADKIHKQ